MSLYRVIGIALLGVSVAAAQQPAQPQHPTTAVQQPPNPNDPVSCRISKDGNSLRRTCKTRSEWKKFDAQSNDVDESNYRNSRCPMGAC